MRRTPPRTSTLTPETYFSVGKKVNYGGQGVYDQGTATFDFPATLADDSFALRGPWKLDYQGATAADRRRRNRAELPRPQRLHGGRRHRHRDRHPRRRDDGDPRQRAAQHASDRGRTTTDGSGHVEVSLSKGLQAFSFTYG